MHDLPVSVIKKRVTAARKTACPPVKSMKKSQLLEELQRLESEISHRSAPAHSPAPAPAPVKVEVKVESKKVKVAKKAEKAESVSDQEVVMHAGAKKGGVRKSAPVPEILVEEAKVEEKKASRPAKGSEEMKARMAAMRAKKGDKKE